MTTQSVNAQELATLLETNFDKKASAELDARIEFRLGDESLLMLIQDEKLTLEGFNKSKTPSEIVLFFESAQLAYEIFTGATGWVQAFMKGQLKSDSNLVWVFQIVGSFTRT